MDYEYLLTLDGWERNIIFSAAHFIPYHNKCSRLHGHTYVVSVRIRGKLNRDSMVYDFTAIKSILREIISPLDHKVIIPSETPFATVTKQDGKISIEGNGKYYMFPMEDVALLPIRSSTAEAIADYLLSQFLQRIDMDRISAVELRVEEGRGQGASAIYEQG